MMLCIAAMGLSIACSKDSSTDTANKSADIDGYWKCTHSVWHYICISHGVVDDNITRTDECVGNTWQLTENGKIYIDGEDKGGYTVSDGYLVLDKMDDLLVKKYKIEKVTDNTLILSHAHEGETTREDDEYAQNVWLEFEKI